MLRSVCAVALCGQCGLLVPAKTAEVPFFSGFMLRAFSGDNPHEHKSGFAVEMSEMAYTLQDTGPHSLILVDELGKGTEVLDGTSIAGALLEEISSSGCRGIFATHLHLLHSLPLNRQNLGDWRMDIQGTTATWRIKEGRCHESLALKVAEEQGVPEAIVQKARQYRGLLPNYQQIYDFVQQTKQMDQNGLCSSRDAETSSQHNTVSVHNGFSISSNSSKLTSLDINTPSSRPIQMAVAASAVANKVEIEQCSSSSSHRSIHDAAELLQAFISTKFAPCEGCSTDVSVCVVEQGHQPIPRHDRQQCVYVIRWEDGWFYAGQSKGMKSRIKQHESRRKAKVQCAYACIGNQLQFKNREAEAELIRSMNGSGFPMVSTKDGTI